MPIYRCPAAPTENLRATSGMDILGCGHIFEWEPDDEGLVDCPECGIWFDPSKEKNAGPFSPVEMLLLEEGEE